MHTVSRKKFLMMESIVKALNSVNSANYQFDNFLSVSAWSSFSNQIISAERTA